MQSLRTQALPSISMAAFVFFVAWLSGLGPGLSTYLAALMGLSTWGITRAVGRRPRTGEGGAFAGVVHTLLTLAIAATGLVIWSVVPDRVDRMLLILMFLCGAGVGAAAAALLVSAGPGGKAR